MRVVVIIQARMGSTRLPGKVLRFLGGKTVLAHVIERALDIRGVTSVLVATTLNQEDDEIVKEATRNGAQVFRGSESDVLKRYVGAASAAKADIVIRITSDCPLLDSTVVTDMLARFLELRGSGEKADYMSNGLRRTFPRGLDAEVLTTEALLEADRNADKAYEREHVTPFIYQHPERFGVHSFESNEDLSGFRWTLDTEQDYEMLKRIFENLSAGNDAIKTADVLGFLRSNPEVALINSDVQQKTLGE